MEAVILIFSAWIAVLYLEALYWTGAYLLRWAPAVLIGFGAGRFAHEHGLDALAALTIAVLSSAAAYHVLSRT